MISVVMCKKYQWRTMHLSKSNHFPAPDPLQDPDPYFKFHPCLIRDHIFANLGVKHTFDSQ